ncbi:MAG: thymidine phosphorylase [Actinomycetota bacterium]|jgi:thymidine phosphorylase|nr:thymidine phosphorylase [Actinomycetota bacterium]
MDAIDVIRTKRDGGRLSDDQIDWFIKSYTNDEVPDYQASALLMAIVWRGMEPDELARWTAAMISSGEKMDLSDIDIPTVDKHSTGGVGDKVSLILAPLVAACGVADPMLSGRGLGHTGGTLDKLEAIPGFRVDLSPDEFISILKDVGCVICSAGPNLAPADRKLYALRDVTGTVESIPLIASSIMSKKIAEGTDALVLDVKVGSGAFLPKVEMARELAETMVGLGSAHGVKTTALLTAMDTPLGRTAGNGLEVIESVECLRGEGPDDLMEVTLALAREMLDLAGVDTDPQKAIDDGSAMERYERMVKAQGGDPNAKLAEAPERRTIDSPSDGYLARLDARAVGIAAWRLGAGRSRKEDPVSDSAGVVCLVKPGEQVAAGQPILELHAEDPARFAAAESALEGAIEVGAEAPEIGPLVIERIGS